MPNVSIKYNNLEIAADDLATPVEIIYNNDVLTRIDDNENKTLACTAKAMVDDIVIRQYEPDYLCITAVETATIKFSQWGNDWQHTPVIQYKVNNGDWANYTFDTDISLAIDDSCYWRGDNLIFSENNNNYIHLVSTAKIKASGNVMSLVDSSCFSLTIPSSDCFTGLFRNCSYLITPPKLPATILKEHCYGMMFWGCNRLEATPDLPATTLAYACYDYMFYESNRLPDCTNIDFTSQEVVDSGGLYGLFAGTEITDLELRKILPINSSTNNPYLPVTELNTPYCYSQMFIECDFLTKAPELPATVLSENCYNQMFQWCERLVTVHTLPAIVLENNCYDHMFSQCYALQAAPALPALTLANSCYNHMFWRCTSLVTPPALPATNLADECYYCMFDSCTSLTTVPELPAITLTSRCYEEMFWGCTSLQVSDTQTAEAQCAWVIPSVGTFTNTTTYDQSMFYGCLGTRSSNTMSGAYGESHTYYTQNQPISLLLPEKGDLISIILGNSTPKYGNNNLYRVLSITNNIAEVVAIYDIADKEFGTYLENTYTGSILDTYLNDTFYSSLSSTAKAAIVDKNIIQYQYSSNPSVYSATTHASYADYSTKASKAIVGNRHIYALDIEDIEIYFNNTFSALDLNNLFWNTVSTSGYEVNPWLRSAETDTDFAWHVRPGITPLIGRWATFAQQAARPAFQIDLSKISWSKVS